MCSQPWKSDQLPLDQRAVKSTCRTASARNPWSRSSSLNRESAASLGLAGEVQCRLREPRAPASSPRPRPSTRVVGLQSTAQGFLMSDPTRSLDITALPANRGDGLLDAGPLSVRPLHPEKLTKEEGRLDP